MRTEGCAGGLEIHKAGREGGREKTGKESGEVIIGRRKGK